MKGREKIPATTTKTNKHKQTLHKRERKATQRHNFTRKPVNHFRKSSPDEENTNFAGQTYED